MFERLIASDIRKLPHPARALIIDALRVRAMDFVQDRLKHNDFYSDQAADVFRELVPSNPEAEAAYFDPDAYAPRAPGDDHAYAATEVLKLLKRGPSEGEDFFRMKITGNGETRWVNVTPAQVAAIATELED